MPVDLTNFEKGQIVAYRDCGKSYKYIADKLQDDSITTIFSFLMKLQYNNNFICNTQREGEGLANLLPPSLLQNRSTVTHVIKTNIYKTHHDYQKLRHNASALMK